METSPPLLSVMFSAVQKRKSELEEGMSADRSSMNSDGKLECEEEGGKRGMREKPAYFP